MTVQLHLLDETPSEWRIPEETKALGRKGIAQARAALHRVPRRIDLDLVPAHVTSETDLTELAEPTEPTVATPSPSAPTAPPRGSGQGRGRRPLAA